MLRPVLGLDLGTSHTKLWCPRTRHLLHEPTLYARRQGEREPAWLGRAATRLVGRTPRLVEVVAPWAGGRPQAASEVCLFLSCLLRQVVPRRVARPHVVAAVPAAATAWERQTLLRLLRQAGCGSAELVPAGTLAALAVGVSPRAPDAVLLVDLGAGTTKVEVVARGRVLASARRPASLFGLVETMAQELREEHGLLVGEDMRQRLLGLEPAGLVRVVGRDRRTGLPRAITVPAAMFAAARKRYAADVAAAVAEVLATLPPEASADVGRTGATLLGGGARLSDVAERVGAALGLTVTVVPRPELLVARGLAAYLDGGSPARPAPR